MADIISAINGRAHTQVEDVRTNNRLRTLERRNKLVFNAVYNALMSLGTINKNFVRMASQLRRDWEDA